jgi:hypothetical protein
MIKSLRDIPTPMKLANSQYDRFICRTGIVANRNRGSLIAGVPFIHFCAFVKMNALKAKQGITPRWGDRGVSPALAICHSSRLALFRAVVEL